MYTIVEGYEFISSSIVKKYSLMKEPLPDGTFYPPVFENYDYSTTVSQIQIKESKVIEGPLIT